MTTEQPKPVLLIAGMYALLVLLELWAATKGVWKTALWLPLHLALAIGLWQMKSWARIICVFLNSLAVIVLPLALGVSFWRMMSLRRSVGLPNGSLSMAFLGLLLWTAICCALPAYYLTRPAVRKLFR